LTAFVSNLFLILWNVLSLLLDFCLPQTVSISQNVVEMLTVYTLEPLPKKMYFFDWVVWHRSLYFVCTYIRPYMQTSNTVNTRPLSRKVLGSILSRYIGFRFYTPYCSL
jgi:hypothetical protein